MTERTMIHDGIEYIGKLAIGDGWEEGSGYSCDGCHFHNTDRKCQHPLDAQSGCCDDPVIIWVKNE